MIKVCKKLGHEYSGKQCQKCKNLALKRWAERNPDKVKENSRKYYEKNSEVIKQKVNEWRKASRRIYAVAWFFALSAMQADFLTKGVRLEFPDEPPEGYR